MEHEQTSPTQATTQDTASHEEPQRQVGYEFPWGEDEDEDAAHRALLDLQSGVEDPAETPSSGFETLKLDLMKAIQPYNLHEITRSDESQVAVVYNEIYLDLILGKYRACLTKCKSSYNSYFQRDKKNVNDWPQPDFPLREAVHCWKLGIMRAMILPFKYSGRNIAVAGGANHYWTISEPVLAHIYGDNVPKSFKGSNIRGDFINAERQRIIRLFRQKKMGKVEEKEDLIRNGNRQETVEDAEVVEKTGGFLPANDELYGIRYQRLFPGFHYTA